MTTRFVGTERTSSRVGLISEHLMGSFVEPCPIPNEVLIKHTVPDHFSRTSNHFQALESAERDCRVWARPAAEEGCFWLAKYSSNWSKPSPNKDSLFSGKKYYFQEFENLPIFLRDWFCIWNSWLEWYTCDLTSFMCHRRGDLFSISYLIYL
jgi:hypothetical protein